MKRSRFLLIGAALFGLSIATAAFQARNYEKINLSTSIQGHDPGGALAKTDSMSILTAALEKHDSVSTASLHKTHLGFAQACGMTEVLANKPGVGLSGNKHDSALYALHLMDNMTKAGMASAKESGSYMHRYLASGLKTGSNQYTTTKSFFVSATKGETIVGNLNMSGKKTEVLGLATDKGAAYAASIAGGLGKALLSERWSQITYAKHGAKYPILS